MMAQISEGPNAHLKHGTTPSRKARNVRRYLNVTTLENDGLIVVHKDIPCHTCQYFTWNSDCPSHTP